MTQVSDHKSLPKKLPDANYGEWQSRRFLEIKNDLDKIHQIKKKILLFLGKLSRKPFQGLKWDHKPQAFKNVQQITEERIEAICSHKNIFS